MYITFDQVTKDDFGLVKEALLDYFNINAETYRRRYKQGRRRSGESWVDFTQRILLLKGKWTKECKSAQKVRDVTTMEDILSLMPEKFQSWVRDQKPTSAKQAASLADSYYLNRPSEARLGSRSQYRQDGPTSRYNKTENSSDPSRPTSRDNEGSQQKPPTQGQTTKDKWLKPKYDPLQGPRCFRCNEYGHIADSCPTAAEHINLVCDHPRAVLCSGAIGHQQVVRMLVDTGAARTIVNRRWIPANAISKSTRRFVTFHGAPIDLHLAKATISVGGRKVELDVAVKERLQYDAIL